MFELTKSKSTWGETILYSFTGQSDGGYPYFGLAIDSTGNLYGATSGGGSASAESGLGNGVVFEITP